MSHLLTRRSAQPPEPLIAALQFLLQSQPNLTPDFLQQLSCAAVALTNSGHNAELQLLVTWVLQQSYCDRHSTLDRLKLLQWAWPIQQRLWRSNEDPN